MNFRFNYIQIEANSSFLFSSLVSNLEDINFENNSLARITNRIFSNLRFSITIFLNDNKIIEIDDNSFKDCNNLSLLSLVNNQLEAIYEKSFIGL